MKTKPKFVTLPLVLTFEDWKRLRTTSIQQLRDIDIEVICSGVLNAVHKLEPKVYMCIDCKRYIGKFDLTLGNYGARCPHCDAEISDGRDAVTNLHNL